MSADAGGGSARAEVAMAAGPEAWEAHVRAAGAALQGPACVLEVDDINIYNFCQGDLSLLENDLRAVLPPRIAEQVLVYLDRDARLADAFHVRREMINFKKVCLNVWQDADKLEKDLRQLCSFFHESDALCSEGGDYHILSERYTEICQRHKNCKGALEVVSDTRRLTKSLCCVPRIPGKPLPSTLADVPKRMKSWRDVQRAGEFLDTGVRGWKQLLKERMAPDADANAQGEDSKGVEERCPAPEPDQQQGQGNDSATKQLLPQEVRSNEPFEELGNKMELWGYPDYVLHFIKKVMVARGGAKALWIAKEAKMLHAELEKVYKETVETLEELRFLPGSQPIIEELKACTTGEEAKEIRQRKREELMEALYGQRHLGMLIGIEKLLKDVCHWTGSISVATVASKRLFLAGDLHGAAMFTPEGFQMVPIFEGYRAVRDRYQLEMHQAMNEWGWPPAPDSFLGNMLKGEQLCRVCQATFSSLWVHRGVCTVCEKAERASGRCPYRAACSPASFCPHLRACFVCSGASCDICGLVYGDGEDVQCLVERLSPRAIYIDFDRTLCTTKGGGSPMIGNHSLDPGLASVLTCFADKTTVVTRNSFRDDIMKFMAINGLGSAKIFTTRKHQSKAEAMLDASELGPGECVVFVDDSIAEHIDPRLTEKYAPGQLTRVLFSRARI